MRAKRIEPVVLENAHVRLEPIEERHREALRVAGAINPASKRAMMAYGFESLGLNRIELKLDATNARSWKAIERLGARREGVHRQHMVLPDGRLRDTAWFSVLAAEWPAARDGLDARLAAFRAPKS